MNIQEAKETILKGKPKLGNKNEYEAYRKDYDAFDEAMQILINQKYDSSVMVKILNLSDKVSQKEEKLNEIDYNPYFYEQRENALKMIDSEILSKEFKIKQLEREINELDRFRSGVERSFEVLRIHLEIEIEDNLKKESKRKD